MFPLPLKRNRNLKPQQCWLLTHNQTLSSSPIDFISLINHEFPAFFFCHHSYLILAVLYFGSNLFSTLQPESLSKMKTWSWQGFLKYYTLFLKIKILTKARFWLPWVLTMRQMLQLYTFSELWTFFPDIYHYHNLTFIRILWLVSVPLDYYLH